MQTNAILPLKSYYWKFFWVYLITTIVVLVITVIATRFGLHAGLMAVQVVALMTASFYVIQKFVYDQKRFFTKAELSKMVNVTTLIAAVFQICLLVVVFSLLGFAIKQLQNSPADAASLNLDQGAILATYERILHAPSVILIMLAVMIAITFLIQTLNFRFLGRRMSKR